MLLTIFHGCLLVFPCVWLGIYCNSTCTCMIFTFWSNVVVIMSTEKWSISNFMLFAGICLISISEIKRLLQMPLKYDYCACSWFSYICASKSIILLCDHICFILWCLQIWNRHQQDESRDHHFFSFPCVSIQPIRNHLTLSHG